MVIKARGYASLKRFTQQLTPDGSLSVPDSSTVMDVLRKLALPEDTKAITLINGRHCKKEQVLREGDTLVFFPPLEGG